ncbi:MAG: transcription-repair coupling factor [Bacteroidales bacterium]|nr:transcription-repair coupling factor [Bacteroidales bacterium]
MAPSSLQALSKLFGEKESFRTLSSKLNAKKIRLSGLQGSAIAFLLDRLRHPVLCISKDEEEAGYLFGDLSAVKGGDSDLLFFPSLYRRGIRFGQKDGANEVLRSEVVERLIGDKDRLPKVIVTYPAALLEGLPKGVDYAEKRMELKVGDTILRKEFREKLWDLGFEEVDYVYAPGQFAVRGSLFDIFSYAYDRPIRLDFFGDDLETIRPFDPETQLSAGTQDSVTILADLSTSATGSLDSLLSLLPKDTRVYIGGWDNLGGDLSETYTLQPVHPEDNEFRTLGEMQARLIRPDLLMKDLEGFHILAENVPMDLDKVWTEVDFLEKPEPLFHKQFDLLSRTISEYRSEGYEVGIMSNQESQIKRLESILSEQSEKTYFTPISPTLHGGFIDSEMRVALFSDHTIFERFHSYKLKSDRIRSKSAALTLKELKSFEYGDYIVHVNHGIGTFGGLFTIEKNGMPQEVVRLNYKDGDSIYVSIHSLNHISKYKSKDNDEPPRLSKLGSGAWEKVKERTKKKVKDIARDLIKLYAKRLQEKGFAFSPDTYLQKELESSFQYEDTPDQEKATQDVKRDMERPIPMDRLICGDVGFGKTEVAIRAAFKAVSDSKQVAVMVPTTVLAYQHYRTFSKRLSGFPATVAYLTQSKSPKEKKEILSDLSSGKTDIIIGTHLLTGKNVKYKDLGLLIIDEEQKFGVSVKEKLRSTRAHIDTLTMSATPIPRTLQFSLLGARDLSNILTPPPNRHPIRTERATYSPEVIAEAIGAELAREGQVFFIHNRIHNIEDIARDIRAAVPGVRIGIAHGRLPAKEIEEILLGFINHDFDVLLATSIVENGIDVPNANTIIINDAQRFGLSDLHQLRGRVGRGTQKAYCILLTPSLHLLTPNAKRRLESITTFSDLGSGIQIAMQDLDIRGAGNLLGAEQSGFIADLGYETYKRILEEAVMELKNDEFADLFEEEDKETDTTPKTGRRFYVYETVLDTDLPAFFPPSYVPGDDERINLYKELDGLENTAELKSYEGRLINRFGNPPLEAVELLNVMRLRLLGKRAGIERILLKRNTLTLQLVSDLNSGYYKSKVFGNLMTGAVAPDIVARVSFKEEHSGRSITIKGISSLTDALTLLSRLSGLSY